MCSTLIYILAFPGGNADIKFGKQASCQIVEELRPNTLRSKPEIPQYLQCSLVIWFTLLAVISYRYLPYFRYS